MWAERGLDQASHPAPHKSPFQRPPVNGGRGATILRSAVETATTVCCRSEYRRCRPHGGGARTGKIYMGKPYMVWGRENSRRTRTPGSSPWYAAARSGGAWVRVALSLDIDAFYHLHVATCGVETRNGVYISYRCVYIWYACVLVVLLSTSYLCMNHGGGRREREVRAYIYIVCVYGVSMVCACVCMYP